MKVSREKAAQHRGAIVDAAGRLFRARGFNDVSVAEITRAAGLTHGGFYGHFASKEALARDACEQVFAAAVARLRADGEAAGLEGFVTSYLSEGHRDRRDRDCPLVALATEVLGQDLSVQARFAAGTRRFAEALQQRLPAGAAPGEPAAARPRPEATPAERPAPPEESGRRERALLVLSALVGGLALARAAGQADPELSREIMDALRAQLLPLVAAPEG
ncbi:TetR/AcrR family transcriptional regulator [Roseomonas sp. BN140053]|uniref:TetR/AcrR family transcriptional regulator n=1 Tax=Roseomonas sp. BN140053 TaxID=3391898 RepID=UPI0039E9D10B